MAIAPVTWRSVAAPDLSSASNMAGQAAQSINRGLDTLNQYASQERQFNINAENEEDQKVRNQFAELQAKDDYDAASKLISSNPTIFNDKDITALDSSRDSYALNQERRNLTSALFNKDIGAASDLIKNSSILTAEDAQRVETRKNQLRSEKSAEDTRIIERMLSEGKTEAAQAKYLSNPYLPASLKQDIEQRQIKDTVFSADKLVKDLTEQQSQVRNTILEELDTVDTLSSNPREVFDIDGDGVLRFSSKATKDDQSTVKRRYAELTNFAGVTAITDKKIMDQYSKQLDNLVGIVPLADIESKKASLNDLLKADNKLTESESASVALQMETYKAELQANTARRQKGVQDFKETYAITGPKTVEGRTTDLTSSIQKAKEAIAKETDIEITDNETGKFTAEFNRLVDTLKDTPVLVASKRLSNGKLQEGPVDKVSTVEAWMLDKAIADEISSLEVGFVFSDADAENFAGRVFNSVKKYMREGYQEQNSRSILQELEAHNLEQDNLESINLTKKQTELTKQILGARRQTGQTGLNYSSLGSYN